MCFTGAYNHGFISLGNNTMVLLGVRIMVLSHWEIKPWFYWGYNHGFISLGNKNMVLRCQFHWEEEGIVSVQGGATIDKVIHHYVTKQQFQF